MTGLLAAVVAMNISAGQFKRGPWPVNTVGGDAGVIVVEPTPPVRWKSCSP